MLVGLGAFAAPLVATQFAQQEHWSYHYLISASIGVVNVAFLAYVFRFKNQDGAYTQRCFASDVAEYWVLDVMEEAGQAPGEADMAGQSKYKQIMGLKSVHFLACWALIYVGVEVTLGGELTRFQTRYDVSSLN